MIRWYRARRFADPTYVSSDGRFAIVFNNPRANGVAEDTDREWVLYDDWRPGMEEAAYVGYTLRDAKRGAEVYLFETEYPVGEPTDRQLRELRMVRIEE